MSKKLDTTAIRSELAGSVFFPLRLAPSAEDQPVRRPAAVSETTKPKSQPVIAQEPVKKAAGVAPTTPPTASRPYVRRTFDIFDDQLAYMTRASLEDRLAGGEGSMNSMVREALDAFIDKHRKK